MRGQADGLVSRGLFAPPPTAINPLHHNPPAAAATQLWEYWGFCGDIEGMDVMTFPDTGRFRGIAFITFQTVRWRCGGGG